MKLNRTSVLAGRAPRKAPVSVGISWTQDQLTWIAQRYHEWPRNVKAHNFWVQCAKEFNDKFKIIGKLRTPGAIRKQISLLQLAEKKQTSKQVTPRTQADKCIADKGQPFKYWHLLVEKWIDDNVPSDACLSNDYLRTVASACYKYFQDKLEDTLEDTLKDTLEDTLGDLRRRSIDAWSEKIKRMRKHRKYLN